MENKLEQIKHFLNESYEGNTKYDIEKTLIYTALGLSGFIFLTIIATLLYHLLA